MQQKSAVTLDFPPAIQLTATTATAHSYIHSGPRHDTITDSGVVQHNCVSDVSACSTRTVSVLTVFCIDNQTMEHSLTNCPLITLRSQTSMLGWDDLSQPGTEASQPPGRPGWRTFPDIQPLPPPTFITTLYDNTDNTL